MSGEKRSQERDDTLHEETVIIVDIEGTTTSISFVKVTKSMADSIVAPGHSSHFIYVIVPISARTNFRAILTPTVASWISLDQSFYQFTKD